MKNLYQRHLDIMECVSADPNAFRRTGDRRRGAGEGAEEEGGLDLNLLTAYVRLLSDTERVRSEIYRCPSWKEEMDQQSKMEKLDLERRRMLGAGGEEAGRIILAPVDPEEPEDCPEV